MDYNNLFKRVLSGFFLTSSLFVFILYLNNYFYLYIILIYLLICYEIYFNFKINYIKLFFLYFYILISFISIQIYLNYYYDRNIFLYFIAVIISFDSISYIFGSLFGKKKIFSIISPSKTYIGLFFGILLTFFLTFFLNEIYLIFNSTHFFIFTSLIIFTAFFGDIIESYFKRHSKIKDSSNLLPGHGGFFDRFDGFIMSTIPLLIFSYYS